MFVNTRRKPPEETRKELKFPLYSERIKSWDSSLVDMGDVIMRVFSYV